MKQMITIVLDLKKHSPYPIREKKRRPVSLDEIRRVHIQRVLQHCDGNRSRAAKLLGIGRTSLFRYLRRDARLKAATADYDALRRFFEDIGYKVKSIASADAAH